MSKNCEIFLAWNVHGINFIYLDINQKILLLETLNVHFILKILIYILAKYSKNVTTYGLNILLRSNIFFGSIYLLDFYLFIVIRRQHEIQYHSYTCRSVITNNFVEIQP